MGANPGIKTKFIFLNLYFGLVAQCGVFPIVLLRNYRLLVLDPNFLYFDHRELRCQQQFIKYLLYTKVNVNKHTVNITNLDKI